MKSGVYTKHMRKFVEAIKDITKQRIVTIVHMFCPGAKVYLFGSYARGDFTNASDIDIAIDAGEAIDLVIKYRISQMVDALDLVQKTDVVDFHRIPEKMKTEILQEGILWEN